MILVLGSTGTTGREIARQLINAGQKPRLLVRSRAKAAEFADTAEIVTGELGDAEAVAAALRGVEKLYLISSGLEGFNLEISTIEAAKRAGVEHIVKLSVISADKPTFSFSKWHAQVEQHLQASGLEWTMLRPGSFMSNSLMLWAATIKDHDAFYQPTGAGRWAAIDPADIGAVGVKALTEPGHEGKGYTLTGPESLNGAEYAEILSAVLRKPIRFVDVSPEAALDGMLKSGIPRLYADAVLDLMAVMKANEADFVSDTYEQLMGRKPTTFAAWVERNAAAFQ